MPWRWDDLLISACIFWSYAEIMDEFNPELVMKTIEDENITGFLAFQPIFMGCLA